MIKRALILSAFTLAACATTEPAGEVPAPEVETASLPVIEPVIPMPSKPYDTGKTLTRITFGSCNKQEDDQSFWNTIAAADSDLFVYLGDNVYGDVWSKDPQMPELRKAYRTLAMDKTFKSFRAKTPMMVVWDDHDYGLNDAGGTYELKYGGEALFEEAWALPANDPRRARDGVYTSEIFGPEGQRVQIILLDTRFFRSDLKPTDEKNAPGKERYLPDPDPSKTMLGEAQYEWLLEELMKPAELRLIVSSIQVLADGHGWEAWATLPTDRQRLYDTIGAAGAEHVVLISGDRHAAAMYATNEALPYRLYEMTTSSLNAPASVWRAQSGETRIEDGPNRLGTMEYEANFGQVDVDWEAGRANIVLKGMKGEVLQDLSVKFSDLTVAN